jgi:hypothetical protein
VAEPDQLPIYFRGGISATWRAGFLGLTLDAEHQHFLAEGEGNRTKVGIELGLFNMLYFRGGMMPAEELGKMSAGFGAALQQFRLDYAYVPYALLGNSHRFQLSFSFETPSDKK